MKKSSIFYILACMTSLFIFSSCEENVDQVVKTQPDATQEITNRSIDDCEDCPQEYCCCGIELLSSGTASVRICGVYTNEPALLCTTYTLPSGCGTISSSFSSHFDLDFINNPRELFCLPEGNTLRIVNLGSSAITIRFTCQVNVGNPEYESFTLQVNEDIFFSSDGSCSMGECF